MALPEPLTAEEEKVLGDLVKRGDLDARNELVERNMPLVHYFARKHRHSELPYDDIVSYGNLGLIRAANKFDPDRGVRFSSYAAWWIKAFMQRGYFAEKDIVRTPINKKHIFMKYSRTVKTLTLELKREPTVSECAVVMKITCEQVEEILRTAPKIYSVDDENHDNGHSDLPIDTIKHLDHQVDVRKILSKCKTLSDQERMIIHERFFNDCTLEVVARKVGLTRERIRQIEVNAILKLRSSLKTKRRLR